MTDLNTLAERCERSDGGDRELDALLHCVREELDFVLLATGNEAYGDICDPSDSGYGRPNKCTPGKLYARFPDHKNPPTLGGGKRANKVQGCTPDRYTASIDAALTLVPEECLAAIKELWGGPRKAGSATVAHYGEGFWKGDWQGLAATPAPGARARARSRAPAGRSGRALP